MADRIVRIKNTGPDGTWSGQTILTGEYYDLVNGDVIDWPKTDKVFTDIGSGVLIVNKGADTVDDILDPIAGWKWLIGDTLPISELGNKLAVHQSSKPDLDSQTIYAVWAGSGDDMTTGEIGGGSMLIANCVIGTPQVNIKMEFHPDNGRIWIHEGYLKFQDGGIGDYIDTTVYSNGVPLQTSVSLDLVVTNNWITYAPGGAGTGTHGFADASKIIVVPREYSLDGDWDLVDGNLVPNMLNTGKYKMSDIDQPLHKFFSKIPCQGDCHTYFSMTSDETVELVANTYLQIEVYNNSNTNWNASAIVEIYREKTVA